MCWNAEVSLYTFIYGFISAIIVYALNVIPIHVIIILMSFTSMQLLEYFTWTYMDNKKINEILSYIGLLLIIIQIFLIICFIKNKKSRNLLLITFSIVLILFILIEFKNITFKMTRGKNGHLVWHWLDMPIIWIIIALLFYTIPSVIDKNYLSLLFIIIILTLSLYYYFKAKTWGTMWCYFSNIAWIFLIFKSIFLIYSNGIRNNKKEKI